MRYTELNPVRARLCLNPTDWPWSGARAHFRARHDTVVSVQPMLERVKDWGRDLSEVASDNKADSIRRCASTGRPAGDEWFGEKLEALTGRELKEAETRIKTVN